MAAIAPNYLSTEFDRKQMLAGARMLREFAAMPSFQTLIAEELRPGGGPLDDDEMWQFIEANAWTVFHPCCICKMGQDPMAVVDEKLRVRGVEGLRVADASIMPTLISGNTNAPSIMIGEKAAHMVLEQ